MEKSESPKQPVILPLVNPPLIHRDVSWMQFNERVLEEALAGSENPLLERVKFLGITSSNLDEFFMIRVASLYKKIRSSKDEALKGLTPIRDLLLSAVTDFVKRQGAVLNDLVKELNAHKIHLVKNCGDNPRTEAVARTAFSKIILPKLSPPETFDLGNLTSFENQKLAVIFPVGLWFRIPRALPPLVPWKDEASGEWFYFFIDDLLQTCLGSMFGLSGDGGVIKVTRDADFNVELEEEDPHSIPDKVIHGLGNREKGAPVRLQYRGSFPEGQIQQIGNLLKLSAVQIMPAPGSLMLHGLWTLVKEPPPHVLGKADIHHPANPGHLPEAFQASHGLFERLRARDFLLHHPYDSFDAFLSWMKAVVSDPGVVMIEQTVYRTDQFSPLMDLLKKAASKKRVRVIIELRARFDEFNNLRLAEELRKAGVEVAFGFGKLKLHAKVTLITRREGDKEVHYTHLSTGNYNSATARVYTDLAILTSNAEIGNDARLFFDSTWNAKVPVNFARLVTAPGRLHRRLLAHIQEETQSALAGKRARIVAKVNALVDTEVIQALYQASQAGVQVDLIVRGACALLPGVKGLSENISVISIVDRYLEHSRIYYFESSKTMYLSSADWMPRNFFSRLEIAYPVLDPRIFAFIENVIIPAYLKDNVKARVLGSDGKWKRRTAKKGAETLRAQAYFEMLAEKGYKGTPLVLRDEELGTLGEVRG